MIVYLDDFLVLGRNKAELTRHTAFVLDILRRAGFQRNPKKCHLEPRQPIEYLGLLWSSKEFDFKRLGRALLSNPSLALAQKLLGKAVFARRVLYIRLGRLLLRPLHMAVIQALRSGELILDNESRLSIRMWTRPPTDGMDLTSYIPQLSMTTDASNSGWGATLDDRSASGRWSAAESDLHINHLELLAVFRGVKSFRRHLRNRRMTVHLDSITATAHLSKEGGTLSAHLNKLTMEILLFCRNHGAVLTPASQGLRISERTP